MRIASQRTILWVLGLALGAGASHAATQGFSYGGRLADANDVAVTGPVDLELRFYHAPSGGAPIADSSGPIKVAVSGVALDDGIFQVDVAVPPTLFDGDDPVWVEVKDATHGDVYPRQKLVAMPYALKVPVDPKRARFDAGQLTIGPNGAAPTGQFLTTDADGNFAWASPPSPAFDSSTLAGDVTGTPAASVVARLQGRTVSSAAPASGQVLKWDGTQWMPAADATAAGSSGTVTSIVAGSGLTGGTITGSGTLALADPLPARDGSALTSVNAAKLQGRTVDATAPSSGQVLKWSGTAWAPAPDAAGSGTVTSVVAGTGLTGGTITATGTVAVDVGTAVGKIVQVQTGGKLPALDGSDLTAVNGVKLQGRVVAATAPTDGQVLKWNNSAQSWQPGPDDGGVGGSISNGANLGGSGAGIADVFTSVSGANLQFRRLKQGPGIVLTENANDVTITAANVADNITDGVVDFAPSQNVVFDALAGKAAATHTHPATDIGSGNVSNVELDYLDGVTSAIQTQLNGKLVKGGDSMTGGLVVNVPTPASADAINIKNSQRLKFENDQGTPNTITFRAPTGVITNQSYVLPSAPGTLDQVLKTDAGGTLSWWTPGISTLAQFTINCSSGQVLKSTGGGGWTCQNDADSGAGALPNDSVTSANIAAGAIVDSDVNASAAITRSKLAPGSANHVLVNDGAGSLISEAQLALVRGGTGADGSNQSANYVLAAPTGGSGPVTYRPLVAADVPVLDAGKITTGSLDVARGGTGADGSSKSANLVLASPLGSTGPVAFRALGANDIPALDAGKITTGILPTALGGTGVNSSATFPSTGVVVTDTATQTLTNKTLTSPTITGGGSLQVGLGTVGAPSYSFTGDTNNGIFSSAADVLNLATNGAERMRIDSTGKVGIGTTTPSGRLDIVESASSGKALSATSFGTSGVGVYGSATSSGGTGVYGYGVGTNGYGVVGYTNVATGTAIYGNSAAGGVGGWFYSASGYGLIVENGNVGIGTTAPTVKLDVVGGVNTTGTVAVKGNGELRYDLTTFGSSAYPILSLTRGGGTAASPTAVAAGNELAILNANGYFSTSGVQTGGQLMFEATEAWTSGAHGTRMRILGTSNGTTNTTEWMRLVNGNVGIGTTTPSNMLTVAGTVESTSGGFRFPDGSTQTTATASAYAAVHRTSSFTSGASVAWTALPMNQETVKSGITHSTTTNPDRITVTSAGVYQITYSVNVTNVNGSIACSASSRLFKNGSAEIYGTYQALSLPTILGYTSVLSVTTITSLIANDYVAVQVAASNQSVCQFDVPSIGATSSQSVAALTIVRLQ